jgi:hypothetical protein
MEKDPNKMLEEYETHLAFLHNLQIAKTVLMMTLAGAMIGAHLYGKIAKPEKAVIIGDVNHDGYPDLRINERSNNGKINYSVLYGTKSGEFYSKEKIKEQALNELEKKLGGYH